MWSACLACFWSTLVLLVVHLNQSVVICRGSDFSWKRTDHPRRTQAPGHGRKERLDSWKENRRLLQPRPSPPWQRLGAGMRVLPVHRQQHDALGSVYAYKSELEGLAGDARGPDGRRTSRSHTAPAAAPEAGHLPRRCIPTVFVVGAPAGPAPRSAPLSQTRRAGPDLPKPVRRLTNRTAQRRTDGVERHRPDASRSRSDGSRNRVRGRRLAARGCFVRPLDQRGRERQIRRRRPLRAIRFTSPDGNWIGFFDGNTLKKGGRSPAVRRPRWSRARGTRTIPLPTGGRDGDDASDAAPRLAWRRHGVPTTASRSRSKGRLLRGPPPTAAKNGGP